MFRKDYRFVFIITYARSGSTLLQSLLNSAPGVQIRGENSNALYHLYQACQSVTETASRGRFGQQAEPDMPWYGAGATRPLIFKNQCLEMFLRNVLAPDAETTVTGFKEIRHVPFYMKDAEFQSYMDFLIDEFPGARIVFNSRNAEAVSKSAWLAESDPKQIISDVMRCDQRFRQFTERSELAMHMRYEDYVADHGLIHELFHFLDLEFDPAVVERVFSKPLHHAKK